MGMGGIVCGFRLRFLWSSLVLFEFGQVHFARQLLQCASECLRAHSLEDDPFLFRNRDHHAVIGTLQMPGQVIARYLIGNLLLTVHAAQRAFDYGQDVVGDQRNTESEQYSGPRI